MTNDTIRGDNMNKWIDYEDMTGEGSNTYECPCCNFVLQLMEGTPEENSYNYCPKCGKKLIQQNEEGIIYEQNNL